MSHYPAISHAFVLREVEHVRAAGVDLETLSTHRAEAADLLAAADRSAAATTFSVLPTSPGTLLGAHLEALIRSPRRYLATLALALRTGAPGARERLWHLFYFAEAMILLRHCRRAGIAHIHAQFADSATDVAMLVTHYRRGQRVKGVACSWSLAVHGSVEFYDVTRYALASKLAHAELRGGDQRLRPQPAHDAQPHRALAAHPCRPLWRRSARVRGPARTLELGPARGDPLRGPPAPWKGALPAVRGHRGAAPAGARRGCDHRRRRPGPRGVRSGRPASTAVGARPIPRLRRTGRHQSALCPRRHLLPAELR